MIISGTLRFPPGRALTVRVLRVSIRNIGPADAPDVELAAATLPDIVVSPAGTTVPFRVEVDLPPGTAVAVRAHADLAGTGAVRIGDLVSTTRHTWPADELVIPLESVR